MKIWLFSAVFSFALCKSFIATPVPQATADGLIFCCTEDEGVKQTGTSDTIVNPPGSKNSVRISQQKCLENSALFCPEPKGTEFGITVVGGTTVTDPGAFPHIVALGWRLSDNSGFSWRCGGSLVSEFYVLTAAHCTFAKNDGLVGLTEFVRPVCLWQNETMEQTIAKAIGWGKTSLVGSGSVTLQEVVLSFFTNQQCRESFGVTRTMNQGVIPHQLCAGNSDGGKDTCSGDSGGPLTINLPTIRLKDCVHHQVGITSFGIGCGSSIPAVYTRVSRYIDWIERVVWP